MPRHTPDLERHVDSLFVVLTQRPWTATAVLIFTGVVFALGVVLGARIW